MQRHPGATAFRVPPQIRDSNVTLGANDSACAVQDDTGFDRLNPVDARLEAKARAMHALVKTRDRYFRRAVMADGAMGVILSLFLAELQGIPVTEHTLALINLLEGEEGKGVIHNLIHAGLVVATGANPGRRTVGLTALGSARMRSVISDYPDI